VSNLLDPEIVEFGLEIVLRLKEDARRFRVKPTVQDKLGEAQAHLIRRLMEIKRRDHQG
jgi:hypothetical protein